MGLEDSQWNVFLVYALISRLPGVQRLCGTWILFFTSAHSKSHGGPSALFWIVSILPAEKLDVLSSSYMTILYRKNSPCSPLNLAKYKTASFFLRHSKTTLWGKIIQSSDKHNILTASSYTVPTSSGEITYFLYLEIYPTMPFSHSRSPPLQSPPSFTPTHFFLGWYTFPLKDCIFLGLNDQEWWHLRAWLL